jgi:hypothetical protein
MAWANHGMESVVVRWTGEGVVLVARLRYAGLGGYKVLHKMYNPIPFCLIGRDLSPGERRPTLSQKGLVWTDVGLEF